MQSLNLTALLKSWHCSSKLLQQRAIAFALETLVFRDIKLSCEKKNQHNNTQSLSLVLVSVNPLSELEKSTKGPSIGL